MGASYFMTPDLEVLAGTGFGSKAIPDKTLEPALLDFDAFTASLGAYYALGKAVRLGATYTQVFYLSRDTTGKSMFPGQQPPSRSPDSGGKYAAQLGLLNANVNVAF